MNALPRINQIDDNDSDLFPNINCQVLSISDFELFNLSSTNFSIIHVNVRSCRRNFSGLESFLSLNDNMFD
jgi:hypothetical protein